MFTAQPSPTELPHGSSRRSFHFLKFRIQQCVLLSFRSRWDSNRDAALLGLRFTPEGIVRTEDLHQARLVQRATGRILDFFIIIRVLFPNEGAPPDEVCFFIFI